MKYQVNVHALFDLQEDAMGMAATH
ncbi:hypothetical protein EMIT0P253_20270 [Pseudomonas sp. IT-P253]